MMSAIGKLRVTAKTGWGALATAILLSAVPAPASACVVPVSRYALEMWPPDPYILSITHGGQEEQAIRALVEPLRSDRLMIDLQATTSPDEPARFSLIAPWDVTEEKPIWQGELTPQALTILQDSPARRALAREFANGATAIWLFLPSGDESRDIEARQALAAALGKLEETTSLPQAMLDEASPELAARLKEDLRIAFPIVTVDLAAEEEILLRKTLAHLGYDLELTEHPAVAPVYGQGRLLDILALTDGVEESLGAMTQFITGSCSCEIKQLNPGFDIYTTIDWNALTPVRYVGEFTHVPPLVGASVAPAEAEEVIPQEDWPPSVEPENRERPSEPGSSLLWMALGGVLLAAGVGVFLVGKLGK